jgi:hypothetical protein
MCAADTLTTWCTQGMLLVSPILAPFLFLTFVVVRGGRSAPRRAAPRGDCDEGDLRSLVCARGGLGLMRGDAAADCRRPLSSS